MLILIISITILAAAIGGFLTYVGVDSIIKNKKEAAQPIETQPQDLYRVRAFPFAYKKEDTQSTNRVLFAQVLYSKDEEPSIEKGGGNNEK